MCMSTSALAILEHVCALQCTKGLAWWWLINPLLASLINGLIVLKQLCQSQWCMAAAQQQLQEIRLASGWCRAQRPEHTTPAICSQRQMVWGGGYLTCIIMIDITNKTCWWSHLYKCINQSYFSFSLQYIINLNIINYYTIQFDSRISLVKHFKNKNMKQYIDSKKNGGRADTQYPFAIVIHHLSSPSPAWTAECREVKDVVDARLDKCQHTEFSGLLNFSWIYTSSKELQICHDCKICTVTFKEIN